MFCTLIKLLDWAPLPKVFPSHSVSLYTLCIWALFLWELFRSLEIGFTSCTSAAFGVDCHAKLPQTHQTQHRVCVLHVYGLQQFCGRTWLWIHLIPNPALLPSFSTSVAAPLKVPGARWEGSPPFRLLFPPVRTHPRWDQDCSEVTKKGDLSFRKHVLITKGSCFENHYPCGLMPVYMYTACGLSFEVRFCTLTQILPQAWPSALLQWLELRDSGLSAPREQGLVLPQDRQRGCHCARQIQEDLLVAAA